MSFLFGGKKGKHPAEIVRATRDLLQTLEKAQGAKAAEKPLEEIAKNLSIMKLILYGDQERPPEPELVAALSQEIYVSHLLPSLISNLHLIEFESRKDVAQIFNNLLRKEFNGQIPCAEYVRDHPEILESLLSAYDNPEIALNGGLILRECLRHEELTRILLYSPSLFKFFRFVESSNFDIASDAFVSLKELLTRHKALSAEFLERNYDAIFQNYYSLVNSSNYVTRRQSLKLLGELLLDRTNFNVMTRYISDVNNLKAMMTLLRDKSKNIQFEAFHVFKVFVANPNKPQNILDILLKNKERLITFLSNFQNDKEDEQFKEEKSFLVKQIKQLDETN